MKKLSLSLLFVSALSSFFAQKIYSVDADYKANVKVFVVDDNSTLEYIYWLKEYQDLEIKYIKNENRLGAFSNILNCFENI